MAKKFVAKKKGGKLFIKLVLWVLIATLALVITFNILLKLKVDDIFKHLTNPDTLFKVAVNEHELLSLHLLDPSDLLRVGLGYKIKEPAIRDESPLEIISNHENDENPRVYIYSSHDTEEYDSSLTEAYNIKYTVTTARYILSENLKSLGIENYVERESMTDYLRANNLNYNYSYYASKYYLEERLREYPSIDIVLDIHRDALPRYASVATIDGKPCAKVIFIVAVMYDGYEENVALAEAVNSRLPGGLSRGLSKGNGYGANGYFNQEVKKGALLIEIGGNTNTIEEVANTSYYVAKALYEVLNERDLNGKKEEN